MRLILIASLAVVGVHPASAEPPSRALANCPAFVVTGDPTSTNGASWTYASVDQGVSYALQGVLFVPTTRQPHAAVVVSHGKGGLPTGYSATIARTLRGWGLVAIGTMYTHAPDAPDAANLPQGPDGASEANVLRAHKTRDLLACVPGVDLERLAAHGHSMGAFVTGQLLGAYPNDFRVASHSAGGTSPGPNSTRPETAAAIVTPYQLHHGDADTTVALAQDIALAQVLSDHGVAHELRVYPGGTHQQLAFEPTMLTAVQAWYVAHGLWP